MPIKVPKNFERKFHQEYVRKLRGVQESLIARLFYIGEKCLNYAREHPGYTNQTGNLCSSIGYCVVANGQIVHEGEWQMIQGSEGRGYEGMTRGMEYLHKLAAEQPAEGVSFIMVAGMPYAQYVEAIGKNVLDGSEILAEQEIKSELQKMGFQI